MKLHAAALLIGMAALTGCAGQSPAQRLVQTQERAQAAGWQQLTLPAGDFTLSGFAPANQASSDALTIYIEGDGLAWINRNRPSGDPTPTRPTGLELAMKHRAGNVAYVARPCQYATPACTDNRWWTNERFSPAVIAAMDSAVGQLKTRYGAARITLVGYSGGGAVAALLAARRTDVEKLITVAGNLDTEAWVTLHDVSALSGSLNPADSWRALEALPQLHLSGANDKVVPPAVAESYAAHFPPAHRPALRTIEGFDHQCCWADQWPGLMSE